MTEKEYRKAFVKGYLECVENLVDDIGKHKEKVSEEFFDLLSSNTLGLKYTKEHDFDEWIAAASDNEIHTEED